MKKLFFFRSSAPSNTDRKGSADRSVGHEVEKYEHIYQSPRRSFSKSRHQASDSTSSSNQSGSALKRSRSLTSAAFLGDGFEQGRLSPLKDLNRSPARQTHGPSFGSRKSIPEKQSKSKQSEDGAFRGYSSSSSGYVSSRVVDRYIEGEQHQDKVRPRETCLNAPAGKDSGISCSGAARYTAPSSPSDYCKSKSNSHSVRETKGSFLHLRSRDWAKSGFGHESPRTLAKNVMERLTQTTTFPKANFDNIERGIPITIRDVYSGSSDKCFDRNSDVGSPKGIPMSEPYAAKFPVNDEGSFRTRKYGDLGSEEFKDDLDVELRARHNEARVRVALFSEELQDDQFLQDFNRDVPTLMRTFRNLSEERLSLAAEVVDLLQSWITDRSSGREELRMTKAELQLQNRRLEKEKKELQLGLEKELDRRSSDWSCKLEKIQLEEQRLRERVRELAEENVLIQREVYSINERDLESRSLVSCSEQQIGEMKARVEEFSRKNRDLQQDLSDIREKFQTAEETGEHMKRNFIEKERECKELHKSITRLSITCSDQQKTIEGLRRGLDETGGTLQTPKTVDGQVSKTRMEIVRLTGVELSLRKELEANRRELDCLRRENISLLGRLKGNGDDYGASLHHMNEEMNSRVGSLQSDALFTLNHATELCTKILEFVKSRHGKHELTNQGIEAIQFSLDGQYIVEADMKLQGIKCKAENLTMSFQTISKLLQEKAKAFSSKSRRQDIGHDEESQLLPRKTPEDALESELKAESLMTRLLKEKLYSKELELEQLQADLATAVRAADCVKSEVQNALDSLSSITHKLKELELQMRKKDEKIRQLEIQVDESMRELNMMKGVLPKLSQERDQMWQDNMVLSSEVDALRKKIDELDEVVHEKEGQISILTDALRNKPTNLLDSPDFPHGLTLP
ncbi:hypothetical protein MLD38_038114 [Melastoma candidum]|uniref:Uncharacterized protein n=1 Tax=Melastoma candidum TaxID=119954 RepID=A0ACB9KYR3_9MYRT|nr:hypothetical protein MLD38_038114 [Melastoma candidum]